MHGLLQPAHLFFLVLIVLILLGPGKLPKLDWGRAVANFRGEWSGLRGAAFMAKGVDPKIGRDVGDMLPDDHAHRNAQLYRCLLAILIGNTIYFLLAPILPAAARLSGSVNSGLPALTDLWFCFLVFGVLTLLPARK